MNFINGKRSITRLVLIIALLNTVALAQLDQNAPLVSVDDDSDLVTILKADVNDPFSKEEHISFKLKDSVHVSVKIVTPHGHVIRQLLSAELNAGVHKLTWDGFDDSGHMTSSGVFIFEIHARHIKRSAMLALLN